MTIIAINWAGAVAVIHDNLDTAKHMQCRRINRHWCITIITG